MAEGFEDFRLLLSLPPNIPGLGSRIMILTPVATVTVRDVTSESSAGHVITQ